MTTAEPLSDEFTMSSQFAMADDVKRISQTGLRSRELVRLRSLSLFTEKYVRSLRESTEMIIRELDNEIESLKKVSLHAEVRKRSFARYYTGKCGLKNYEKCADLVEIQPAICLVHGVGGWHAIGMNRQPWTAAKSDECENKRNLRNIIEPSYGLLNKLLSNGVLNRRQYDKIRAENSTRDRNDMLLKLLSVASQSQWKLFEEALIATNQEHVVNCIHGRHDDHNNDWPLNEGQRSKIERNANVLARNITLTDEFMNMLQSKSCITWMQKADLQKVSDPSWLLLDIMRRRSVKHFENFIEILRQTGQHVAANILLTSQQSRYDPSNPLDQWLGTEDADDNSAVDVEETTTCEHEIPKISPYQAASACLWLLAKCQPSRQMNVSFDRPSVENWMPPAPPEITLVTSAQNQQPDQKMTMTWQQIVHNQEENHQLAAEQVRFLLLLLLLIGGSLQVNSP